MIMRICRSCTYRDSELEVSAVHRRYSNRRKVQRRRGQACGFSERSWLCGVQVCDE
jgi:hypothetical protein